MKIHRDIKQGSTEWLILRSAKVTASCADSLVSPTGKVKTGDGPRSFMYKLLAETWIGGPLPAIQGIFDIEQGQILETQARPAFEFQTGLKVEEVGFIESDDGLCGASPDGLTSDGFGLEIKAPRLETHIKYLLEGICPDDYKIQVQFSMFASGFSKWWFCSYRRNFPLFTILVERDEKIQNAISEAVKAFRSDFDAALGRLVDLNGSVPDNRFRGNVPFPKVKQPETATVHNMDIIP